jgi:hypothetical protein
MSALSQHNSTNLSAAAVHGDQSVAVALYKKRKIDQQASPTDVSWTVCCMDGTTFSVAMPEHACVSELKRAIGALRELPYFAMELFIKGVEDALSNEKALSTVDRVSLFMLPKVASDRLALEALFQNTGGEGWESNDGWCTDADLGDWRMVKVDAEGRVIKLKLAKYGLVGSASSELQQLSCLRVLWLHENQLAGCIPPQLGQLKALTYLYLQGNQLTGSIPAELGQLGALARLHLGENQLTGPIPAELGQLGALTCLWLNDNQLTGSIPMELGQGARLVKVWLNGNQLTSQQPFCSYMQEHRAECDVRV